MSSDFDNRVVMLRSAGYFCAMARTGADLAILLLGGFRSLADAATAELARRGHDDVRPAHDFAMRAIAAGADNASELGRRLAVSKQAAAKTIAQLEERGYVSRTDDPADARRKLIGVTPLGHSVMREGEAIFEELRAAWEARIGVQELARLEASLVVLVGEQPIDLAAPGRIIADVGEA